MSAVRPHKIEVSQDGSFEYTGTLKDETGVVIPASSLFSFTLTLLDSTTGQAINGRNTQDALNLNQVTVSAGGVVQWVSLAADNPLLDPSKRVEVHIAIFHGTYPSGTGVKGVTVPVHIYVHNPRKV